MWLDRALTLLLLATLPSACSALPSSGTAPEPKPRDEWMAGSWSWTERDGAGLLHGDDLHLTADGTGERVLQTVYGLGGYGVPDELQRIPIRAWWSHDGGLVVDDVMHTLLPTPNCRLVEVDGSRVYRRASVNDCPFSVPPLTDEESALVGTWQRTSEAGGWSYLYVTIEADRNIKLDELPPAQGDELPSATSKTSYFELDTGGVLHARQPNGEQDWSARVRRVARGLELCRRSSVCQVLTKG